MSGQPPTVVAVHTSSGGIPKTPVDVAQVDPEGLRGDGHNHDKHNTPMQAVCLIDLEDLEDLRTEGFDLIPGSTGENVTLRGLDVDSLSIGDRLAFSGGVCVELTKRRKPCYVLDAIDPALQRAIAGRCGFYARVIEPGELRAGERIDVQRGDSTTS